MRNLLTAIVAFLASALAGSIVVYVIAVETRAQEEFILAFSAIAPLGLVVVLPLLVASYMREPRRAVSRVARWLLALMAILLAALFGYAFYAAQSRTGIVRDLPVLAGISIPAIVILAMQWLVFRWRARPAAPPRPMQFGRAGAQ